ncbi:hypothetical protein CCACVL1_18770 [Corchorus capsularis]|uniref:PGG domain-containing protein n=1 Tax=Corchorus capsularis TaxID=210143 RepID=A0A1R3HJY5_COCAP|nr:hypothetical protein CCACVL1_18770 [Corchorus capsularis]
MEMRPNNIAEQLPCFSNIERRTYEDIMFQLYEAALNGSVPTLTRLIHSDPQILHRVSLSPNPETPLHISALAGHLDFTKALLTIKPELASRFDSFKCSPLHLASAEGHGEIVKALLQVNKDVCLVADAEGRIPLHLAAMRGKVEVIQQLVDAQPKSIHQKVNGNYTVFNICIQYNQIEALRQLVSLVNEDQLMDFKDHRGNSILHLAVMLRQSETIRYLVSIPTIKTEVDTALNNIGMSALDMLEYSARDLKCLEIQDILMRAVAVGKNINTSSSKSHQSQAILPLANGKSYENQVNQGAIRLSKLKGIIKSGYRKFFTHQDNWVEKMQKTLMVVATLTGAMSFQVITNPPGGVWQQDYNETTMPVCRNGFNQTCHAGTAVLAYIYPDDYRYLIIFATISFAASFSIVILAISGLPIKNKFCTWLLILAMVGDIIYTVNTYALALGMVVPERVIDDSGKALNYTLLYGNGLMILVLIFTIISLLLWILIGLFTITTRILRWWFTISNSPNRPIRI